MSYRKLVTSVMLSYKWPILCILICGIIIAFSTAMIPRFIGESFDYVVHGKRGVTSPLVLLAIAYSFRSIFKISRNHLAAIVGTGAVRKLRTETVRQFGHRSKGRNVNPVTFYSLCSHDIETISSIISFRSFVFIEDLYIVALSFFFIFHISQPVFFFTVPFLPILVLVGILYGRKINSIIHRNNVSIFRVSNSLYESMFVQKVARMLGAQDFLRSKFDKENEKNRNIGLELNRKTRIATPMTDLLSWSALVVAIISTTFIVLGQGGDASTLIVVYNYMFLLVGTSKGLSDVILFYVSSKQGVKRIGEHFDALGEIESTNKTALPDCINSLELSNLSIQTDGHTIFNATLSLKKGTITVIEGVSGSGKTSLCDILSGLNLDYSGSIAINGKHELKHLDIGEYRKCIGYAMQKLVFFHGTLKYNILLGRKVHSDAVYQQLLNEVGVDDIASNLSDGYDTEVLGNTNYLSGGERQRICLARALAEKPKVIILDDIFTAMDLKRQQQVLHLLNRWKQEHIIVIVSNYEKVKVCADQVFTLGGA